MNESVARSLNTHDPSNDNYSILDQLESFRNPTDNKFTLEIRWPQSTTATDPQIWKQTSNPMLVSSGGVDGYEVCKLSERS
jgi:hypothetical protein